MELASIGGHARHNQNRTNRIEGDPSIYNDVMGMAGEIAVCKYYGVYPDLRIGPNRLGHDLKLEDLRIDVKTTKWREGYLCVGLNHKPIPHFIYLLVSQDGKNYTLQGWQWSEIIIQPQNRTKSGYRMEQSQLRDINEIEKHRGHINEQNMQSLQNRKASPVF